MSIGEALATARADAGYTVEDVSRATRIRGELLRRIEADDFAGCGGAVYARGHIRSIATHVGLDPAPLLAEYDRVHGTDAPAARQIFEHEVVAKPARTGPNWTAAMAVMAGVLLLIGLVSVFSPNGSPAGTPDALPLTTATPSPTVAPPVATQTPAIAGQIPGSGVFLRVKIVNTRSYVTVKADGKTAFQGLMTFPAQQDFSAKKTIHLVIGNAAAVTLVVNGRDLGSPGRPGEVVRLDFGPGDPANAG
ncbi:MAG TPA: RodZ domain-containing protein [Mycobacteriales bacterium]|nr:RodZ domain-containing protein [Mycobacteriales bacterium]